MRYLVLQQHRPFSKWIVCLYHQRNQQSKPHDNGCNDEPRGHQKQKHLHLIPSNNIYNQKLFCKTENLPRVRAIFKNSFRIALEGFVLSITTLFPA